MSMSIIKVRQGSSMPRVFPSVPQPEARRDESTPRRANEEGTGKRQRDSSFESHVTFLLQVVVLGAPGVGKTSIVQQFVWNEFSDVHRPTTEKHSYLASVLYNEKLYALQITDLPVIPYFPADSLFEWADYRYVNTASSGTELLRVLRNNKSSLVSVRSSDFSANLPVKGPKAVMITWVSNAPSFSVLSVQENRISRPGRPNAERSSRGSGAGEQVSFEYPAAPRLAILPYYVNIESKHEEETEWGFRFESVAHCRYYGLRSATAYILVFDVNLPETFQYVKNMREQILQSRAKEVPILVVGNKHDLGEYNTKICNLENY